ncbi:MAG: dienelactone hydrolase family protein [Candidatus Marinimicrobia bacterium]|nr:dienelactone hydrolase family protein [Candidatus Neomarinimicrobiota bacterium]
MNDRSKKIIRIITTLSLALIVMNCSSLAVKSEVTHKKADILTLRRQAQEAYQKKDYEGAAQFYQQVLMHNQDDFTVAYNLACCYALQGNEALASDYVSSAYATGFRNIDILRKDPDFDLIRDDPHFKETVARIEQNFESIGDLRYVKAESLLPYRIRLPKDFDRTKSYPLLIGMHGNGGNADGFVALYDVLEKPELIYICPEGQYPLSLNVGPQWYQRSWALKNVDAKPMLDADLAVEKYILNVIEKVSSEYQISEVYLMGFSQGAVFAYSIGIRNPKVINGVIGFSGYLMNLKDKLSMLKESDLDTGKDVRIYIAHGIDDAAIKVEEARKIHELFKAKGYDVSYMEFEGHHGVKADVFNHAVKWMEK